MRHWHLCRRTRLQPTWPTACYPGRVQSRYQRRRPRVRSSDLVLHAVDGRCSFYDVSNVDGFNLPMSIESSQGCASPACSGDINANCPNAQMAVRDASGRIAGCLTSCGAKCAAPHIAISSNPFAASMDRPQTLRTAAAAPTTRPPPAPKRRSSTILILRTYAPMPTPTPTTSPLLPLYVGFKR
jgi:hypothetical protein